MQCGHITSTQAVCEDAGVTVAMCYTSHKCALIVASATLVPLVCQCSQPVKLFVCKCCVVLFVDYVVCVCCHTVILPYFADPSTENKGNILLLAGGDRGLTNYQNHISCSHMPGIPVGAPMPAGSHAENERCYQVDRF